MRRACFAASAGPSLAALPFAIAAVASACGSSARPALDPAAVPQGTGWFCYPHEQPGTVNVGICYRDRDDCAARGASDGNVPCEGTDRAYCMDLHPGGTH